MKKLIKISFIIAFMMAGFYGFANGVSNDFTVTATGEKSLVVRFENKPLGEVLFSIQDKEGIVLHSETIRKGDTAGRKFNLSNLPAGKYFLEMEDGLRIKTQPVTLTSETLTVETEGVKEVFKPTISFKNGKLDFTMLQLEEATTTLTIEDAWGTTVHNDLFVEAGSLQRRYDLTPLPVGDYTVVVKVGKRVFYKAISVGKTNS